MISFCQMLVILCVLFFLSTAQAGSVPIRLNVGYSTFAAADSALWVAKDLGIFEKNGLDVELIFIRSSSIGVPALMSGTTPFAVMGGAAAIRSNLAGSDLVLVGSLKKLPSLAFLVSSKKAATIEDLKGKTVGVGRYGGATDFVTRVALRKLGIDPERDVKILQIGNTPERTVALRTGAIDATVLSPEEKFSAERYGINVLFELRKLGFEILNTDVVTTRAFIQKNEETVHKFIKAIVEGIRFFKINKKESMRVMAKYMRTEDLKIVEVGYDYESEVYERAPYPSIGGIQSALEEIARENPAARKADVKRFFDARLIQELDKSGFIDGLYR